MSGEPEERVDWMTRGQLEAEVTRLRKAVAERDTYIVEATKLLVDAGESWRREAERLKKEIVDGCVELREPSGASTTQDPEASDPKTEAG